MSSLSRSEIENFAAQGDLAGLGKALQDHDPEVRKLVSSALGKIGGEQAVDLLINLLHDQDQQIQMQAIRILGDIGNSRAVEPLIGLFNHFNLNLHPVFESLTDFSMASNDASKRVEKGDYEIRLASVEALGKIGDPKAVSLLGKVLGHRQEHDTKSKNNQISEKWGEIINTPPEEWDLEKWDPEELMSTFDDYIVCVYDDTMLSGDVVDKVRIAAVKALQCIGGEEVIPPLCKALGDSEADYFAVRALGTLKDRRAIPGLATLLKDKSISSTIREEIISALGQIGDVSVIDLILEARNDVDVRVRGAAIKALGQVDDPRAFPILVNGLQDREEFIVIEAVRALENIGGDRVKNILFHSLMRGWNAKVFLVKSSALARLRDERVTQYLIPALKSSDPERREAAAISLGLIHDPMVCKALIDVIKDSDWNVRRAAIVSLGKIGDSAAVEELIGALRDPDWDVHQHAIESLGEIGDPRAVEVLVTVLENTFWQIHGDSKWFWSWTAENDMIDHRGQLIPEARKLAARALGKIGGRQALEALYRSAKGEDATARQIAEDVLNSIQAQQRPTTS